MYIYIYIYFFFDLPVRGEISLLINKTTIFCQQNCESNYPVAQGTFLASFEKCCPSLHVYFTRNRLVRIKAFLWTSKWLVISVFLTLPNLVTQIKSYEALIKSLFFLT